MDDYTRQCMEHHENNMRIIESDKGLLKSRIDRLQSMKEYAANIRDGNLISTEALQGIKDGAKFFSKTDGLMCLSYQRQSGTNEKWLMAQLCGELKESQWFQATTQQASFQGNS